MQIPLLAKSRLYRQLPLHLRGLLYPVVRQRLLAECQQEGLDFDKAFPPPPGPQQQPGREGPDELIPGVLP